MRLSIAISILFCLMASTARSNSKNGHILASGGNAISTNAKKIVIRNRNVYTYGCITWTNGIKPSPTIESAMELLCTNQIISNAQDAQLLTNNIPRIEVARYLSKALVGSTDISFLDNFPSLYPDLSSLSISDQRYIKLMLYLEYKNTVNPSFGTDDISPFSRDHFYTNYFGSIRRSDGVKAILETWNLKPTMLYFDATSSAYSPLVCDMQVSNKNLGWIQRAVPLGLFTEFVSPGNCGNNSIYYGVDGNLTYAEFYVMLSRVLSVNRPSISYDDFFVPNLFYINNLNSSAGLEKGVFHEYTDNGFSIPSGGIGLTFQHSYHSNLTEIPFLNNDNDIENRNLKPKLQPLGGGWTHTYSVFIKSLDNNGSRPNRILIYWPDGAIHSYLVNQNKYETIGITDKLSIDSYNSANQPSGVTITKGRTVYTFSNIDPVSMNVLSLIKITDANKNVISLSYADGSTIVAGTAPKLLTSVIDSFSGRSLNFSYWANTNYLRSVTDPIGRTLSFNVNVYNHDLDSYTDAKGQTTKYTYSEYIGTFAYRTHLLVSLQKPKGNTVTNTYFSRKLNQTQNQSYVTKVAAVPNYRNQWTQQTSQVATTSNNQTITSNYTFDTLGNVLSVVSPTDTIQRRYNSDNRIILERNVSLGFVNTYGYDVNGYLNKKVFLDSLYSDSTKYEYTNNQYGEVVDIKDYNDQNNNPFRETKVYRDNAGNPTSVVEFEGTGGEIRYTYSYYPNGLLGAYIPPSKLEYNFSYNSFGNVTQVDKSPYPYAAPPLTESFSYDNASRIIGHTDYNGTVTGYTYDANDNVKSVVGDPAGLNLKTQYSYDANDNVTSITSPKGHVTTLGYNFNTDDKVEENDGTNKKRWAYNTDGSLDSFVTKNNKVFKYQYYDSLVFPNTKFPGMLFSDGLTVFSYHDRSKNPTYIKINTFAAKTSYFGYDDKGRGKWNKPPSVSTEGFFSGTQDNVTYAYDRMGRPINVGARFGTTSYSYSYYYDQMTAKISTVQNVTTLKSYAQYVYKNDGIPISEIYGNGDTIFYHYDPFERLDSIWAKNKRNQLLYSIGASFDNNGKHTRENLKLLYQGQEIITLPSLQPGQKSYTYELRNRISSGDGKTFTSTGAGEIATSNSPPYTYTWSDYGQLLAINRNGTTTTYEYDPLGNRKRKDTTYYTVDQENTGNVLIEGSQAAIASSAYVWGNGLIARINPTNDSTFYYHYDFRGSVVAITNQNGDMVQYYKYDPFGAVYDKKGTLTWNNPYQYVGRYGVQTDDSDVYYMKARYYQPSTGRFLSEDPKWNTNLFVYGDDDPINGVDPNGSFTVPILDIAFVALDGYQLYKHPSITNAAFLGWDIISAFVPGLPESIYFRAGKTAASLSKEVEVAKVSTGLVPKGMIPLGEWGESRLASYLGNAGKKITAGIQTSFGYRYFDRLVGDVAHEAKAGVKVKLTASIRKQILKDAELIRERKISKSVWHFFQGASPELLDFLRQKGIGYILH